MQKALQQGYQTLALMVLNTLICLGIFLLLAHTLLPVSSPTEQIQYTISTNYSQVFISEASYFLSPAETRQLALEYDAYALAGHWQAHPWVGLVNRAFKGQYIEVDEKGRRVTTPPDTAYEDKPPLEIWMFGGSTMFGWGVANEMTLPSQFQRELQTQLPTQQVRVINFGVPYFDSTQESMYFIANLRDLPAPDMVIFLDGLNDVQQATRYQNRFPLQFTVAEIWEQHISEFKAGNPPWITINYTFPLASIVHNYTTNIQNPVEAPDSAISQANLNEAIADYRINYQMITSLCQTFEIHPYFFLQPLPAYSTAQGLTDASYAYFYDSLLSDPQLEIIDFSLALEGDRGQYLLLVDPNNHYSDRAIQALAKQMATIILANFPS